MEKKNSSEAMHERILKGALVVFSDKGYASATIKDISAKVGCNTVTIFRHFEDKLGLFLQVIEHYHEYNMDEEFLKTKLSYMNVHNDFSIMSSYFFYSIYQHIDILRIYISDGHNFEPVSKYLWFIPDKMKDFVMEYLEAMYSDYMTASDASMIAELFLSYIIRTCLRNNVHDGEDEFSRKIANEAKEEMIVSVDLVLELIMLHINEKRTGVR